MSKSMAIEGVMQIFLMVAVIIVGMSFLLKAFGIDLFGWIQDLFGGNIPATGTALHVRVGGDNNGAKIYDFHLTNGQLSTFNYFSNKQILIHPTHEKDSEKKFFVLQNPPKDGCIILANYQNLAGFLGSTTSDGYIYVVNPGTTIQSDCGDSIASCIAGKTNYKGCVDVESPKDSAGKVCYLSAACGDSQTLVNQYTSGHTICPGNDNFCSGDNLKTNCERIKPADVRVPCEDHRNFLVYGNKDVGNYIGYNNYAGFDCDNQERAINIVFTDEPKYDWVTQAECSPKQKTPACNLLIQEDKTYQIQYGLLCGNDRKWHTCKDSKSSLAYGTCDWNGNIGIWTDIKISPVTTPTSTILSPAEFSIAFSKLTVKVKDGEIPNLECFYSVYDSSKSKFIIDSAPRECSQDIKIYQTTCQTIKGSPCTLHVWSAYKGTVSNFDIRNYKIMPCGPIKLDIMPSDVVKKDSDITLTASGLSGCNGKQVKFQDNGSNVGDCIVSGDGCSINIKAPVVTGPRQASAFIELDDDNTPVRYTDGGEHITIRYAVVE